MIIKSHIRGGYRAAADYLKSIGQNEKIRLVQISDPDAKNLDEAFQNMWAVACNTKCQKPIHHISVNPFSDERLTDEQLLKIVERAEQKYGYKPNHHQRVIVEHIKDGRQHFHVMWCRVSLKTGKAVWPGEHWKKSKQIAREMERELGLKRPTPRRFKKMYSNNVYAGSTYGNIGRRQKFGNRAYGSKRGKGSRGGSYNRPTKALWRMSNIGHPTAWKQRSSKSPHTISATGTSSKYLTPDNSIKASANAASSQKFARRYPTKSAGVKSNRAFALQKFRGGAINSWGLFRGEGGKSTILLPTLPPFGIFRRDIKDEKHNQQTPSMPIRPSENGSMSLAQRIDLKAAQEGKITWAEYYRKWGGGSPAI